MTIAEKIKELRTAKGMTQKDLADLLFITPQALSRWENGTAEPPVSSIQKLAEIFEITIDELFGKEASPAEPSPVPEPIPAPEPQKVYIEKKVMVPLSKCDGCGKLLYKEEELVRVNNRIRKRSGRSHHYETEAKVYCQECNQSRLDSIKRAAEAQNKKERARGRILRIAHYIIGVIFGLIVGFVAGFGFAANPGTKDIAVGMGVVFGIAGYLVAGCVVLGNTFVTDLALSMVKFGFKLPFGVIFSSIEAWLVFKIVMFLLGIVVGILSVALMIVVCAPLAIFAYPYAVVNAYKHPENCW